MILKHEDLRVGMMVKVVRDNISTVGKITYLYCEDYEGDKGFDLKDPKTQESYAFGDYNWDTPNFKVILKNEVGDDVVVGAIKSDGGSSSYYDIEVPQWLLEKLINRNKEGKCFIKTEEINEILGNDFNYSTIFKSMVRAISIENGVGKAGNTHQYECNKMRYYTDRVEEKFNRGNTDAKD